jgi:hypothetical protein
MYQSFPLKLFIVTSRSSMYYLRVEYNEKNYEKDYKPE